MLSCSRGRGLVALAAHLSDFHVWCGLHWALALGVFAQPSCCFARSPWHSTAIQVQRRRVGHGENAISFATSRDWLYSLTLSSMTLQIFTVCSILFYLLFRSVLFCPIQLVSIQHSIPFPFILLRIQSISSRAPGAHVSLP